MPQSCAMSHEELGKPPCLTRGPLYSSKTFGIILVFSLSLTPHTQLIRQWCQAACTILPESYLCHDCSCHNLVHVRRHLTPGLLQEPPKGFPCLPPSPPPLSLFSTHSPLKCKLDHTTALTKTLPRTHLTQCKSQSS